MGRNLTTGNIVRNLNRIAKPIKGSKWSKNSYTYNKVYLRIEIEIMQLDNNDACNNYWALGLDQG